MDLELGGRRHRARRLSAYAQWDLLISISPMLPMVRSMESGLLRSPEGFDALRDMLRPMAELSEEQLDALYDAALGAAEVLEDGDAGGWVPATTEGLNIGDLVELVSYVVAENFLPFFRVVRPTFAGTHTRDEVQIDPVHMPGERDFLYRPVLEKMMRLHELHDGTYRLEHVAEMNVALDVRDENAARSRKAAEARSK